MNLKSIVLFASTLVLSTSANAALVTQGYLSSYDAGESNIITDTLNNVEYLRLDILAPLNYAQTLDILSVQDGGGWSIANAGDALNFIDALFGGRSPSCIHDGTNVVVSSCGTLTEWTEGKLGDTYQSPYDLVWFADSNGSADYINLIADGRVEITDYSLSTSDTYAAGERFGATPVGWLVTRPSPVPLPAAVWLFGAGLISLVGIARRKKV